MALGGYFITAVGMILGYAWRDTSRSLGSPALSDYHQRSVLSPHAILTYLSQLTTLTILPQKRPHVATLCHLPWFLPTCLVTPISSSPQILNEKAVLLCSFPPSFPFIPDVDLQPKCLHLPAWVSTGASYKRQWHLVVSALSAHSLSHLSKWQP